MTWSMRQVSYTLPTGVDTLILEAGTVGAGNSDATGDALYAVNPDQAATLTGKQPERCLRGLQTRPTWWRPRPVATTWSTRPSASPCRPGVDHPDPGRLGHLGHRQQRRIGVTRSTRPIRSQAVTLTGNSHNDAFVVYNSADTVAGRGGQHRHGLRGGELRAARQRGHALPRGLGPRRAPANGDAANVLYGNAGVREHAHRR